MQPLMASLSYLFRVLVAGLLLIAFTNSTLAQGWDHFIAGNKAAQRYDWDQAISLFTKAIQAGDLTKDDLSNTLHRRGWVYFNKKQYDRAIQDYNEAIRINPNNAHAFAGRGNAYSKEGRYDLAIRDFEEGMRLNPKFNLLSNRAAAYFGKGQYDRAIQDYDELIRRNPRDAGAFHHRGMAHLNKGQYDRAIQDFDETIQLEPKLASAFNNRGVAYSSKGQYDRAIQDFDEALQINPRDTMSFRNRGMTYYRKEQYERAIQDFDEAIRLNPRDTIVLYSRGLAYFRTSQYDRAIQDYDEAIRLNPWFVHAFNNRARARFYLSQFSAAGSDFLMAMKLGLSDAYAVLWLYLARARDGKEDRGELEENMARLDLKDWPQPIFDLYLGKAKSEAVLDSTKDPDQKKAREKQCQAYFFLGQHALIQGNRPEAVQFFKQAVETSVTTIFEYHAAQAELKRLSP